MKYRYNYFIFFIFIFMLGKVGKFLGTSLYWVYSMSLNLLGIPAMVAHSQDSCTCDVNNERHENTHQRKAEMEGLSQAHLIFLSHLKAELTEFSTETYLNQIFKPLHWHLIAQERKSFIGKNNENKKKKKEKQDLQASSKHASKRSPQVMNSVLSVNRIIHMSQSILIWEEHTWKGGKTTPMKQNAVRNGYSWAMHGKGQEFVPHFLPEPDLTPGWLSLGLLYRCPSSIIHTQGKSRMSFLSSKGKEAAKAKVFSWSAAPVEFLCCVHCLELQDCANTDVNMFRP